MSQFGTYYKTITFGESHSVSVGGTIEGVPSNHRVDLSRVQKQLSRRRPQNKWATPRKEEDHIEWLCGFQNETTLGTPIAFQVKNLNIRPKDYGGCQGGGDNYIPRPGHADYTYLQKYGIHAKSGGGRSSARETISRVVSGALAEEFLPKETKIVAWVSQIGHVECPPFEQLEHEITREWVDQFSLRIPDDIANARAEKYLDEIMEEKDSVGGIVECRIFCPPVGLGSPCFDKFEAKLAQAALSIPASKGFEIGHGFEAAQMRGSEHNDTFQARTETNQNTTQGQLSTTLSCNSNHAGGTLGGITTGETISFRVPFKPASSIGRVQTTSNLAGEQVDLGVKGRHDPCVATRAVPVVEGMAAMVLMDLWMENKRHLSKSH